jgi:hypothetical protein
MSRIRVEHRTAGDRRKHVRFEVVGRLVGSIEVTEQLPITNLSGGGACVESTLPLLVGAINAVRVVWHGEALEFHVRVRHRERLEGSASVPRYRLGLEFIGSSPFGAPPRPAPRDPSPEPGRGDGHFMQPKKSPF